MTSECPHCTRPVRPGHAICKRCEEDKKQHSWFVIVITVVAIKAIVLISWSVFGGAR